MIEDGYTYLQISCVLAFSTQIEDTWPFLKIMRRNNPNSLPHNELITDRSGNPYQYFHYTAWGESFAQAEATQGSFSSSYRFNAKELDAETGNYYYGARYYHPKWSVWLGVDPLARESPNQTPYHFVSNNPVMRIDPDGLTDFENSTTGDIVSVADGMKQTVLIDSKNWQTAVDYSKNLDGNNPTDAYNSFISSNGGVAVPTTSKGGVIPDKKMFLGFIEFKFENEPNEVAAFKAKGSDNYYVDSWDQNEKDAFKSDHLKETAESYGYSDNDLTEIFHTHPNGYANASVADAGLSYDLGIPIYSMGYSSTGMRTLVNGKARLTTEIHMATPRFLSSTDVYRYHRPAHIDLNFYGKRVNY